MKSGYNFKKRAFFDVMNEESIYGRKLKRGEGAFNSAHKDVVKRACCR